jgi:hypothetical protein
MEKQPMFGSDILYGGGEIAAFVFGAPERRRKVYQLAAAGKLPIFKLGGVVCARRSKLVAVIEALEAAASDTEAR